MAGCTVLGPIRAFDAAGCELTLVSEPQRRLLAILCLHVGSVVRSAALEEHLSLSAGALRTSISRLRRVIGPDVLVGGPAGYELRADVDVVAYEQLVSEAHDADAVSSRAALERARSVWQGTPYDEFAHEPWAEVEVCRLGELHAAAMEELVALLLDAGDDAAAMAILVPLIDEHPYRDPLRGLLMRALWQVGRTTEALREFQTYRALLRDDIGAEPSAALVDLDRAIVAGGDLAVLCEQGHRAWVRRRRPDPVGDPVSRLSLPTPISSFVGGARETADVAALLQLAEQIVEVADALITDMERAPNLTESLHLARGQIALARDHLDGAERLRVAVAGAIDLLTVVAERRGADDAGSLRAGADSSPALRDSIQPERHRPDHGILAIRTRSDVPSTNHRSEPAWEIISR